MHVRALLIAVLGLLALDLHAQNGGELLLRASGGVGMILSTAKCRDVLIASDDQMKLRRFDLAARKSFADLPNRNNLFPTALAVDCARRVLYVVTSMPLGTDKSAAVYALDLQSGKVMREYPLVPTFLPRPGARFIPPSTLVLGGLWVPSDRAPADLLKESAAVFYRGLSVGLRLSLATGRIEPLAPAYEDECIGGGECPDVRADAIDTPSGLRSVTALRTSTKIGVSNPGDATPRLLSVRSPKFVRDGRTLPLTSPVEPRIRWVASNSVIDRVVAFANAVAVVHMTYALSDRWSMGEATPRVSYVNVYRWNGEAIAEDEPIPGCGFSLTSDASNIYIVDDSAPGATRTSVRFRQIAMAP